MPASGYEFYLRVFISISRYRVEHEKIKFISTSGYVIFCLLYKHSNDAVFDDFPKISDHFPKIFLNCSEEKDERFRIFFRHFPKISEDNRQFMFQSYTNISKYF